MNIPLSIRIRIWLSIKLMQLANLALGKKIVIVHNQPPSRSLTDEQFRQLNAEEMDHITLQ